MLNQSVFPGSKRPEEVRVVPVEIKAFPPVPPVVARTWLPEYFRAPHGMLPESTAHEL
jgi:hypothetical protein